MHEIVFFITERNIRTGLWLLQGFHLFAGDNAMPFISHTQSSLSSAPPHSVFVGRTNELLFFVQHILKPEEPVHNILSIWGQGGVGKTTLLQQFKNQAATADFKAYCLTAFVDERGEPGQAR